MGPVKVIQDLVAVVFLATATDARPSPWALLLLGLPLLRRPLLALLEHAGHGELLILFGVVVAIGGGIVQYIVGFACHIYKRGIPWVFCPTTFLAMCDSCVGGKVKSANGLDRLVGATARAGALPH